jgi:UDP-2,3-diacylglucosamine pyrophosphatase LpxH
MNKYKEIIEKIQSGAERAEIVAQIEKKFSVKRSRANEIYRKCQELRKNTEVKDSNIIVRSRYTYNRATDKYIVDLSCRLDPLVISGARHRAIHRDYSSWYGDLTANEICLKYSLTPEIFSEYRRIFNLTKDREPLTDEEIIEKSVDDNVEALIEQQRYEIYSKFQKEDWKQTQHDADKWRRMQHNSLDTVRCILEEWQLPQGKIIPAPKQKKSAESRTIIVGANDWHIGEKYNAKTGFHGEDFSTEIASKLISDYSDSICSAVLSRNYKIDNCLCILNGDILNSAWDGMTVKGTKLHNDRINEAMFRAAFDSTVLFITKLAYMFPKVCVVFIPGNHDGPMLNILGVAVESYFSKESRIEINISEKWADLRRVGNVGVLSTHGGSARHKVSLPTSSLKLKSYLQDMWAAKSDELTGCKSRIVISGHFHRFWQQDMGNFEFYCLGGLPLGDSYADALNLTSTPRQNCLILDENRVVETLHIYFN